MADAPNDPAIATSRPPDPRDFIEGLTKLGVEIVIGRPGDEIVLPARKQPADDQIRDAIARLERPLPPSVRAEVQRILDGAARRILNERLRQAAES